MSKAAVSSGAPSASAPFRAVDDARADNGGRSGAVAQREASPASQGSRRSGRAPDYIVRAYDDWRSLEPWYAEWERLAQRAVEPAPAAEHWMLIPALRRSLTNEAVRVVMVTARYKDGHANGEEVCGVFPLVLRRMHALGAGIAEFWSHIYSVSAIPLVTSTDAVGCIGAFLHWLRGEVPSTTLLRIPEAAIGDGFYESLLEAVGREGLDCTIQSCWSRACFRPARDAESYLSAIASSHHRKEWRRLERRLSEKGGIAFDELGPESDVQGWLDEFMSIEVAGWKGREGTAFGARPAHRDWLSDVGTQAFARGRLMMLALRIDGKAIAAKLNFLAANGGYSFKIAYDEQLERYSPGVLLELENIRRLHAR